MDSYSVLLQDSVRSYTERFTFERIRQSGKFKRTSRAMNGDGGGARKRKGETKGIARTIYWKSTRACCSCDSANVCGCTRCGIVTSQSRRVQVRAGAAALQPGGAAAADSRCVWRRVQEEEGGWWPRSDTRSTSS